MSRVKQRQAVFFLTLLGGGVLLLVASFFFPDSVSAQIPSGGIIPQCNWAGGQTYGLGAFVLLASNIMKLIWGITGSLALLMFVWGGFQWLTAAGEESRVKAGWDTFINATIGIAIILGSWVIINTVILFLVSPPGTFTAAKLFDRADWATIATEKNTVCIDSANLARGYVPPPPGVAPSSTATLTPGGGWEPTKCSDLPYGVMTRQAGAGETCSSVCLESAKGKGPGIAVDGAVDMRAMTGSIEKGCCCQLSVRNVGDGCGLNAPAAATVPILGGIGGGTPGCGWDQYCDQTNPQKCKKKKDDGIECKEDEECNTGDCNQSSSPPKCGTPPESATVGVCCYNFLRKSGIADLYHTWKATVESPISETDCGTRSPAGGKDSYWDKRFCSGEGVTARACGEEKTFSGSPLTSGSKWKKPSSEDLKNNLPNVICKNK